MRAERVLIVGSAPVHADVLRRFASLSDLIVCADGGGDSVLAANLLPAVMLGDMDSVSPAGRSRLEAAGVSFIVHPVAKDKTDLEIAVDYALAYIPSAITIVGGVGGARLDHTLGNVMLLALPELREIDVRLVDDSGEVFVVWTSRTFKGMPGDYVTLLPLTQSVEGIVTNGLKYPLNGETLLQGSTRGVSNELLGDEARIDIGSGCLLVRHEQRSD
jgi:thiamine pyrophosphokinase